MALNSRSRLTKLVRRVSALGLFVALTLAGVSPSRAQVVIGGGYGWPGYGFGYWPGFAYGYGFGYPYAFAGPVVAGYGYGFPYGYGYGYGPWGGLYGWPGYGGFGGYYPFGYGAYGYPYWDGGWTLASGIAPLAVESAVIERGLRGITIPRAQRGQPLAPGRYRITITAEPVAAPEQAKQRPNGE